MKHPSLFAAFLPCILLLSGCGSDTDTPNPAITSATTGSGGAGSVTGAVGGSTDAAAPTATGSTSAGAGTTAAVATGATGASSTAGNVATTGDVTTTGTPATTASGTASGNPTASTGVTSDTASTSSGSTTGAPTTTSVATSSTAGNTSTTGGTADVEVLDQTNNPVYRLLSGYTGWLTGSLSGDEARANNMVTWQMPHGGFDKNDVSVYSSPWNGSASRSAWTGDGGIEIGTIDNGGTTTELMFLADVYGRTGNDAYRDSARAAFDWLLEMPYPSGGFPQVHPARAGSSYSNHVTFNDDAMVRALLLLDQAVKGVAPLAGDVFTPDQLSRAEAAIAAGIDYILKAQIVQGGVRTVWCAQHDPVNYAPLGARSYEWPSKSGSESAGVVEFLMTQPQTEAIKSSVQAALAWYSSGAVMVENTRYVSRPSGSTDDNYNPIQASAGNTMWYRFYDVDQDVGFFSGRLPTDNPAGVGKKYDIMEIEPERRYGYQWGGSYGSSLLEYAQSVGY